VVPHRARPDDGASSDARVAQPLRNKLIWRVMAHNHRARRLLTEGSIMKRALRSNVFVATVVSLSLAACGATVTSGQQMPDGGVDVSVTPDTISVWDVPPRVDTISVRDVPPADVPVARDVPVAPDVSAPTCSFEGAEPVAISYTGPNSVAMDCAAMRGTPGGTPPITTRTAAVVDVVDDASGSTVRLDFCSPAADCVPLIGSLRVRAPGFNLGEAPTGLRPGQYVQIRSRATWSWGCTMQVEVSNAPTWDRMPNPVRHDSALLAAAASGEGTTLPGAPFELTRLSVGCRTMGSNCGGGPPELFALSAQGHCNTCVTDPAPVTIHQGRTEMVSINANTYAVRNHRSFNTGACDDYWNYAWTAREVWLE
jgi:hypothetical protein